MGSIKYYTQKCKFQAISNFKCTILWTPLYFNFVKIPKSDLYVAIFLYIRKVHTISVQQQVYLYQDTIAEFILCFIYLDLFDYF